MAAAYPQGGLCEVYGDPDDFQGITKAPIERAKRLCRSCPARRECLLYALEHDVEGTWGATTFSERRRYGHGLLRRIP